MSLHDTDALIVEAATATESLPDPTTVSGRTHVLTNTGAVTAVWSSVGATPFTDAGGANVATLSVLPGNSVQVQSDGTRWVVKSPSSVARRIFAGTGVSDGSGNVTFTFTPPFPSSPVVTHAVQTAITDVTECRISALSASSVTFNVRRSPAVVILGISVLQVPVPASGVTVHCEAVLAGQGI
ncbi:hypothetical protein [Streptomyces sp. G1]|uniref:hypothetical protein n=1 Tax=Streptomyces sp. G1 TaxID=361572 RepID=UPI00202F9E29|nr:hypothetical protein [Streptomyces sp. G1]MCM1964837.1 hypothetical protein [Streptomyces sp. G1]